MVMAGVLSVDTTVFFRLLADDGFYAALPPCLAPLEADGRAAYAKALAAATNRATPDCASCSSLRSIVTPVMDRYAAALAEAQAADPAALVPLREYVARRRRSDISSVRMYYVGAGGRKVLEF